MKTIKVTIRTKKLKKPNLLSVFLDYYPAVTKADGTKTRREYLGLRLFEKARTESEKKHNRETKLLANSICSERQLACNKKDFGFINKNKNENVDFVGFVNGVIAKKTGSSRVAITRMLVYLIQYAKTDKILVSDVTTAFGEGYRDFLVNHTDIKQNSASYYFRYFKYILKLAYKQELFEKNLADFVGTIKKEDTSRVYLTKEELQTLIETDAPDKVKKPCIFSSLTGLRLSDIKSLKWNQIESNDDGFYIKKKIQKTQRWEYIPLNTFALEICGNPPEDKNQKVFQLSAHSAMHNSIKVWVARAGIDKNISFHSFRHTFATWQLNEGTDITVVSKMLGHRSLRTTQIYAKVLAKSEREASEKLKIDLKGL